MRIAITGATGNVGTALIRRLAGEPRVEEVLGIARRAPGVAADRTRYAAADIASDDLTSLLEGFDAVVHLAWLIQPSHDRELTFATNVHGSARVFEAAARAGVRTIVYASSVGAYSPGPQDERVDESHPVGGIASSFYSRDKAQVERELDEFGAAHPDIRIVRMRPALIFNPRAADEIRRLFLGPLLPRLLVRRDLIRAIPDGLALQGVHGDDVAEAYCLALLDDSARGAFNVAADPVLDSERLAQLLDARLIALPPALMRAAADLSWRARLQPSPPGWVDMALQAPLLDSARITEQLGWAPRHDAGEALLELLDAMSAGISEPTPAMRAPGAAVGAGA